MQCSLNLKKKQNKLKTLPKSNDQEVKAYIKLYRESKSIISKMTLPSDVTYVIYKNPQVTEITGELKGIRKEPLLKAKKTKVVLTETEVAAVKKNIKNLIKDKLKSKNLEECMSQKRSQPYYMKKEDILQTIEDNPELKTLLPANYKSLTKENLCKYLF